jgi:hypothetical protein
MSQYFDIDGTAAGPDRMAELMAEYDRAMPV